MLEACIPTEHGGKQQQISLSMDEIIHEYKTFIFAGHETTALLLTWTVFLLSVYPEWQERLRKEVLREFGKDNPSGDNLSKLKEARKLIHTLILDFFSVSIFKKKDYGFLPFMEQLCCITMFDCYCSILTTCAYFQSYLKTSSANYDMTYVADDNGSPCP